MKLLRFLLIFSSIYSCNGQENNGVITYPKNKIMNTEIFDISSYEKKRDEQLEKDMLNPWTVESTLTTGEKQELYSSTNGENMAYFKSITPPEPALLKKVKKFHANGKIAVDYETYVGLLNPYPNAEYTLVGKTTYYDENGNLVKIEDNEKTFHNKINLNKLLSFLEKEPLLDKLEREDKEIFQHIWFSDKNTEDITVEMVLKKFEQTRFEDKTYRNNGKMLNPHDDQDRKSLIISYEDKKWMVKKDLYPFGYVEAVINAESGKVIEKKYYKETRP